MKLYYSKSAGGFYSSDVHATIPKDAVEITEQEHAALLEDQAAGKVIASDKVGNPVSISAPLPTQGYVNAQAKALLAQIDLASVRAIREWLAAQPNAPKFVKDHEASAQAARALIK